MPVLKPSDTDTGETNLTKFGKVCTVGCKMPNGLVLRLMKRTEQVEQTPAGPRPFIQFVPDLEQPVITVRGYGGAAFGVNQPFRIAGQYALTENVPTEFMVEWLKQNKDLDAVKNGIIFIQPNENEAAAHGKDQASIWDGLNPLKMHSAKKDPRVPKKVRTASKNDDDGGETLSSPTDRPMPSDMRPASAE